MRVDIHNKSFVYSLLFIYSEALIAATILVVLRHSSLSAMEVYGRIHLDEPSSEMPQVLSKHIGLHIDYTVIIILLPLIF